MTAHYPTRRPIVCVINDKENKFQTSVDWGWNIIAVDPDLVLDLEHRVDDMNPDCVVVFMEPTGTNENWDDWMELRENCEMKYIPFLIVIHEEAHVTRRAMWADGAYNFSNDMDELRFHAQFLMKRRMRILDQILIDPITGIPNYRYLLSEVEKQLNELKRSHETLVMVYVQLDSASEVDYRSKQILKQNLADFIQHRIRPMDCVAHHSDEGFIMVLPRTVKEDALKLMHRLTKKFAETPLSTPNGVIYATFSCKVLEFADAEKSVDHCLSRMPFTDEKDLPNRSGLIIDGAVNRKEEAIRKLKVAIIDDDRMIREMLRYQLSDIGEDTFDVEVKVFTDGEEFFNNPWHHQNEKFLLIIDRIMPRMDGLEILNKIRSGYDKRRYICLMLSSKGAEADIALAIQCGANDYIVKPFSLKELRVRVKRLIGGFR